MLTIHSGSAKRRNARKKALGIFDAQPVKAEVLSARDYVALTEHERSGIVSTMVVAPKLGHSGFGGIWVEYKNPVFRVRR